MLKISCKVASINLHKSSFLGIEPYTSWCRSINEPLPFKFKSAYCFKKWQFFFFENLKFAFNLTKIGDDKIMSQNYDGPVSGRKSICNSLSEVNRKCVFLDLIDAWQNVWVLFIRKNHLLCSNITGQLYCYHKCVHRLT